MLTINEIRDKLADRNLVIVADGANISYGTLYKISKGEGNPSYNSVKKVSDYLEK